MGNPPYHQWNKSVRQHIALFTYTSSTSIDFESLWGRHCEREELKIPPMIPYPWSVSLRSFDSMFSPPSKCIIIRQIW